MKKIFLALGALISLFAMSAASSACSALIYQPKVPKNLKK